MVKEPFENRLGKALKIERQRQGLRQADLASRAGLSIPTIRLLESGFGNLSSWQTTLDSLELQLHGRNLPKAEHVGMRVALLRKRRQVSQRELAKLVEASAPTIIQLEREGTGRLGTLDRVLAVLGAGPTLLPKTQAPKFFVHAGNSSGTVHWNTPPELLEKLYGVFGEFDLDPCSPTADRRRAPVRARVHYTATDEGLSLPWHGVVFLNPPYGREIARWVAKAKEEVESGRTACVVALVPARTDTAWWHKHIVTHASILFFRRRLSFGAGGQSAPFPSALVIWGGTDKIMASMSAALPNSWQVPCP